MVILCRRSYCGVSIRLLALIVTIEESNDLSAGAVVVRAEQTAADAAGDTVLLRPLDCRRIVGVGCHIAEGCIAADSRRTGCAIEEGHRLCAGAGSIGAELAVASAAGDAVFDSPCDCLGIIAIRKNIGETAHGLGSRAARRAPQEGDDLGTGAGVGGAELAAAGACGFTDDGIPLKNAAFLYKAMEEAKALDLPISLHEEDPAFIETNGINHGPVSDALGIYGSPSIAEESLVARDCLLALRSGAQVVIQHISSGQSVELVRTFKAMGANLHAEATPHHFTLTDEAVLKYGSLAKMNPPLRTENDRLAIIEGLKDGTIDLIATDHAPHSTEEKSRPITQTPSGIIGLETSLALGITSLVRPGHLTLSQLIEKMTINPASLYHLPCGSVAEGKSADLVLFDPNEKWTPETYASKSSNSPFTGWELYGKVKYTICDGKIVYKD